MSVPFNLATIPTAAGDTDTYIAAPCTGRLLDIHLSGGAALATSDTNYVTFAVTNVEAGATTAMLAATDANTTKATGGTAIASATKRTLTKSATAANLLVTEGDRIRIRVTGAGTLANTVTLPFGVAIFERTA
jgi:fumarylacetoacetate (FAA) hydrolase family protein